VSDVAVDARALVASCRVASASQAPARVASSPPHYVRPAPRPPMSTAPRFLLPPPARARVSVPPTCPRLSRRLPALVVPRNSSFAYAEVVRSAFCTWLRIAPTKSCGVCISPVAVCCTTTAGPFIQELSCSHLLSTECPL
jgi:hypothetical protein